LLFRPFTFFKLKLGATRLNPIEFTDSEIVEDIWREISFPTFSTYLPLTFQYLIDPSHRLNVINEDNPDDTIYSDQHKHTQYVYQIDPKIHIHSIQNVQYTDKYQSTMENVAVDNYRSNEQSGDPYAMAKIYDDYIIQSYFKDVFNSKLSWRLRDRNQIVFTVGNDDGIDFKNYPILLTINTYHTDTITMPSDMITTIRKLLLSDVMDAIGNARSRFNTINTPQGQINLNGQRLLDEAKQLHEEAIRELEDIPPHEFFYWVGTD